MNVVLHQFAFSHFNEKARWALAFKGISYTRNTYLPGPHMAAIKRISGQTQTPVLQSGDTFIPGSAAIINHLESTYPQPSLYPTDPEARDQAMAWQTESDKYLGPAVRTVLFSAMVKELGYLARMFAGSKSAPKRIAYRASLPLVKGMIAKGNGADDPENIKACFKNTGEWLDRLSDAVQPNGYLVGDQFSIADLSAAALLAPIASVDHPDMKRPDPVPERLLAVFSQFADHPTIAWVNNIYAHHRP